MKNSKTFDHFNCKYSLALRKKVINVFKDNTTSETAKKLGLTHNQVVSIMETSRRKGLVGPAFKDTRRKDKWTFQERLELIRMAGLINRAAIGKKLNRCGQRNIKERIKNDFNSGTKFLHGPPASYFKDIFPIDISDRSITTKAGPNGKNYQFCFKIIPWVELEQLCFAFKISPTLKSCIKAMAAFQRFIWQEDKDWIIRKRIEGTINEK